MIYTRIERRIQSIKKALMLMMSAVLLLTGTAGLAASWADPEPVSPYGVAVIPLRERTVFGQTYTEQYFGAAAAGDDIAMAIRIEVPENAQPATLRLEAENAVLNCVYSAELPMAQGVYYLQSNGVFFKELQVIKGYCSGVPTVSAHIDGKEKINSIGQYAIIRSDGYIVTENRRGMAFHTDAKGKVYAAFVLDTNSKTKLTAYLLNEDSEAGVICRNVLRAMDIDSSALLDGSVYMTDRLLAANFGALIDTEAVKSWGAAPQATPSVTALPLSTVPEVPATGIAGDLFVCGGILAMVVIALAEKRKRP